MDVPFAFDRNKVIVHRDELAQWFDRLLKARAGKERLRITRIVRTNVRDLGPFDRAFLDEHLKGEYHRVVNVTVGEETVVVFLARRGGKLKVVGFSD